MFKKSFIIFVISCVTTIAACNAYSNIPGGSLLSKESPKNQIVVSGRVSDIDDDSFKLNYGKDSIKVEMSNWSFDDKSEQIRNGERVTVYGYIDNSWFERHKLQAQAVYIHDRNTYFIAGDNKDYYALNTIAIEKIPDNTHVSIKGKVIDIDGEKFTLKFGADIIDVDVSELEYNPFAKKGNKKIKVNDLVYVSGKLDSGFFEDKEIKADSIIKLRVFNF